MSAIMAENRTFAEIKIGDSATVSHGLTKAELEGFAAVSGDFNPTHLNEEYARARGLRAPVAHGMWTASLISSLLGNELPGAGTVYVRQDLHFHGAGLPGRCRDGHRYRDRQGGGQASWCGSTAAAPTRTASWCSTARPRCGAHEQGRDAVVDRPTFSVQTHDGYEELLRRARHASRRSACAVAHPCDESSLRGAVEAAEAGLIAPDPGRPGGEDPAAPPKRTSSISPARDRRRAAQPRRRRARRSSWCAPARPSC